MVKLIKKNQNGFSAVEVVILIFIISLVVIAGWLVYDRQINITSGNADKDSQATNKKTENTADTSNLTYQSQKVTSGEGSFTVDIPQGWGVFLRPLDSDRLLMLAGTQQPQYTAGEKLTITDLPNFDSDSQQVFSIAMLSAVAPSTGEVADFTLPNNGQPLAGKKYTRTITETTDGLYTSNKGDKHYTYVFKLTDGKTLQVEYSVFTDDLNDQVNLVDEIVNTIVIND